MYAALNKNRSNAFGQEAVQRKARPHDGVGKPGLTGLPGALKSGIEGLSGFSMEDVRVHYNSSKPAQLNAMAYTRGTDIHIAPGQERHLPHEAWHVVQQMQGRVRPTMQMHNVPVNDDLSLEHEADRMGARALAPGAAFGKAFQFRGNSGVPAPAADTVQCRKAILGRRMEPYRKDVEGFIKFCTECGEGVSGDEKAKYAGYHIKVINPLGASGAAARPGSSDISAKFNRLFVYEDKKRDPGYVNSVNMYVKKKIAAKPVKTADYKYRVLDTDDWNMEKNRNWIRTGSTGGTPVYNSNAEGQKPIGIDNGGKFRLVGLERLEGDKVFENAGIDAFSDEKNREVRVYKLKTDRFDAVTWDYYGRQYSCPQKDMYASAFGISPIPASNFIAHVINHIAHENLLCIDKIPGFLRAQYAANIWHAFQRFKRFPTVMAQEMEQLQESGYVFARIKQRPNDAGEVIALPEGKARAAQEAAARVRAAQVATAQPVPDSGISGQSAAQDVSGQGLAGQAVPK